MGRYIIALDNSNLFLKRLEISQIYFEDENIHITPTKVPHNAAIFYNRSVAENVKNLVNGKVCSLMGAFEVNLDAD